MDLSENYQFNYQKLLKFLRRTDHNGYMFVMADDYRFVNQINAALVADLKQQNISAAVVFLQKNDQPLFEQIKEAADQVESLIVANLYEVVNNSTSGLNQLLHLNFSREELRQIDGPVLFWVDAASLNIISNHAPDLFSQRRFTTVHFTGKIENPLSEALDKPGWKEFTSTQKFKETEAKIETLKRRLKDAEESGYGTNRIANEIAIPLAKEYAELGFKDKAAPVLEKYTPFLDQNDSKQLAELAKVYYLSHEYPLAIETMQKANEIIEKDTPGSDKPAIYPYDWFYNTLETTDWMEEYGLLYEALALLQKAETVLTQTLDSFPYEWGRDFLAIFKERMGNIYRDSGMMQEGKRYYEESLEIRKDLLNRNNSSEHLQRQLSVSYEKLGTINENSGSLQEARSYYEEGLSIRKQLERNNPENEKYKRDLAVSFNSLGDVSRKLGNLAQAKEYYEQSLQIATQLEKNNPQSEQLKRDSAIYFCNLAEIAESNKNYEEALSSIRSAHSILKALSEANPLSPQLKSDLSYTENKIESLEKQMQQH